MPVTPTYPGVYIEEIPSGVRTITGVSTAIGAFVDYFSRGPMNQAVKVFSFADFERQFGGLDLNSEASYAMQQFFLNGGTSAWVVRTTSANNPAATAAITLQDGAGGNVLVASAASPGAWGNNVRLDVDYGSTDPDKLFNLTVTEIKLVAGKPQVVSSEAFRNLVIDGTQPTDAVAVVNAGSNLIRLALPTAAPSSKPPAQTGTVSKGFAGGTLPPATLTALSNNSMKVALNNADPTVADAPVIQLGAVSPSTTLAQLAAMLQSQMRANPKLGLSNVSVGLVGSAATKVFLQFKAGTANASDMLKFADNGTTGTLASTLGLAPPPPSSVQFANVQQYALGEAAPRGAEASPQAGSDGQWDPSSDSGRAGMVGGLRGDPAQKTGMQALLDVDTFNILCIPATSRFPAGTDSSASEVATDAIALCDLRRAFYILDPPLVAANDTVVDIVAWLDAHASLRSRNAALYFPRVDIPDPLNGFRLRPSPVSGTLAGLYARTDATRGVFKAPAGTDASLTGVQGLEYNVTDGENGVLNPLGINALRTFPVFGPVCWGARTLFGADQLADEYKYVSVRRFALFLEESLFRGTQWVVFEPNDEALWAQIRLNVGAFLQDLFRQGAFQGTTPQQAFFVKVDSETTTQTDINNGIVNIVVGFAPLKPAEFVIIQIQQIAGQV
jgi:phage tail sheath protein FI